MIINPDLGIPLPDGTRLSAKIWMPEDAERNPVPAILEYLPYRKSDGTLDRDHGMHPHFARNGYAAIRVDRRGCGDSEGLFDDEYSEEELRDGVDIINWIAAQPWCSGAVGMQGISWGGFNGLQIAARSPEALKAVISIGTTVDRFHDDIHYKGGIQLSENIGWASTVLSWFSMPPDPGIREEWRDLWMNRLENTPFLAERWTRHSDRDAYWKHGSVIEDFRAIKAPVLVMGGLHDGYRNAMAPLAEHMTAPVKAILGPWSHKYPNITTIGPGLDYLKLALQWWDRWLKGKDTGVEDLPDYTAYVMDSCKPDPALNFRDGKWLGFDTWPASDAGQLDLPLGGDGALGSSTPFTASIPQNLLCGQSCGEFFPFGFGPGELPDDQAQDNGRALTFISEPFSSETIIVGAPQLKIRLCSSANRGQIAVRLTDMRPDGTAMLISHGFLNLRHRNGFESKQDLVAGQDYDIDLSLDQCAYQVPAGHKLGLSISSSYWPFCWPEGQDFTLTISDGVLSLPLCPDSAREISFDLPPPVEIRKARCLEDPVEEKHWHIEEDGTHVLTIKGNLGRQEDIESGIIVDSELEERWSVHPDHPDSAQVEIKWIRGLGRGNWRAQTVAHVSMQGTAEAFEIEQRLQAWDGEADVFDKSWSARVPR